MESYYLKPNIKAEPLIWHWYAWPYLIPPATAACNIAERHLKIMQSYVQNPQIHAQANKDPKLLGGPFIDLEGQRVNEIKELIEQTKKNCANLIALHDSLKEFDRVLQTEAQGDSLAALYQRVPLPLKGLIEIVYDLNNHPSIRLIDLLIYKTYYSAAFQSIALSEMTEDYRKFVLSTPRLNQDNEIYIDIPFASANLDRLFQMRTRPQSLEEISALFAIAPAKQELFKSFFTAEPPVIADDRNYQGDAVRLRYFGHACILAQTKSVSILFDPVVSYPIQPSSVPRYTFADLPDYIDYVVITHNHQDHFMFETLLQLRHKIGHIVFASNCGGALADPSIKLILQHVGFSSFIELKEMETISLVDGELIGLPFLGEHSDLNIQSKLSYYLQLKGNKFIFAADSNNLEPALYDRIFDLIGPIDMLFIGMECDGAPLTWLYGPLLTYPLKRTFDKNRALSGSTFEKAWAIAEKSRCSKAYVYAMGQEPWLNYVMALKYSEESMQMVESNKFVQACKANGIESKRLFGKQEWIIS